MDLTWEQKIKKYSYGIDTVTAIKDELIEYTITKIYI
jgi:hypothetical protein